MSVRAFRIVSQASQRRFISTPVEMPHVSQVRAPLISSIMCWEIEEAPLRFAPVCAS